MYPVVQFVLCAIGLAIFGKLTEHVGRIAGELKKFNDEVRNRRNGN